MAKTVILEFEDDESAAVFVENVRRDAEVYTLDEGAMGGVSNDYTAHYVTVSGVHSEIVAIEGKE